jgi:hypothetical protein
MISKQKSTPAYAKSANDEEKKVFYVSPGANPVKLFTAVIDGFS